MNDVRKDEWFHAVHLDAADLMCSHYKQSEKDFPDYGTFRTGLFCAATVRFVKTEDDFSRTVSLALEPAFAPKGVGSEWNAVVRPQEERGRRVSPQPNMTLYLPKAMFDGILRQFETGLLTGIYAEVSMQFDRRLDSYERPDKWLPETMNAADATYYGVVDKFSATTDIKTLTSYKINPYARITNTIKQA